MKKMKYVLDGFIVTDGDFTIRIKNFEPKFQKYITFDYPEYYDIHFETTDAGEMNDFLEYLMVSFDVIFHHYYVLKYLYKMVEKIKSKLFSKSQKTEFSECIEGNYSGTELRLLKIPDEEGK